MAATLEIDFTAVSPDPDGDNFYVLEACPRQSAGRLRAPRGRYSVITFSTAGDLGASGGDPITWDVLAAYVAKFGPLVSGARYFFRLGVHGGGTVNSHTSKGSVSQFIEFSKLAT